MGSCCWRFFCPEVEVKHLRRGPKWHKVDMMVDCGAAEPVDPMAPWATTRESTGSQSGQTYLSACGDQLFRSPERRSLRDGG